MDKDIMLKNALGNNPEMKSFLERYCSVEFSIRNLDFNYQFKIWDIDPSSIHIVIKDMQICMI